MLYVAMQFELFQAFFAKRTHAARTHAARTHASYKSGSIVRYRVQSFDDDAKSARSSFFFGFFMHDIVHLFRVWQSRQAGIKSGLDARLLRALLV
jgi:hypothetical protein